MAKLIAVTKEHPELIEIQKEMNGLAEIMAEKSRFLEKQIKDLNESFDKKSDLYWHRIVAHMKMKGLLHSSYSQKDGCLGFQHNGEILVFKKGCLCQSGNSLEALMSSIFKS